MGLRQALLRNNGKGSAMDKSFESICMHLGEEKVSNAKPISPPIYQTSLFTFEDHQECCDAIDAKEEKPCFYTRGENPTIDLLCEKNGCS